jgi:hypothetical protein
MGEPRARRFEVPVVDDDAAFADVLGCALQLLDALAEAGLERPTIVVTGVPEIGPRYVRRRVTHLLRKPVDLPYVLELLKGLPPRRR